MYDSVNHGPPQREGGKEREACLHFAQYAPTKLDRNKLSRFLPYSRQVTHFSFDGQDWVPSKEVVLFFSSPPKYTRALRNYDDNYR